MSAKMTNPLRTNPLNIFNGRQKQNSVHFTYMYITMNPLQTLKWMSDATGAISWENS